VETGREMAAGCEASPRHDRPGATTRPGSAVATAGLSDLDVDRALSMTYEGGVSALALERAQERRDPS